MEANNNPEKPQAEAEIPKSWMNIFVNYTKIPFLIMLFIFLVGGLATYQIPKESAPQIDFGTILINTVFEGASSVDTDQLVTQEIEQKIKDIDGINKISSTSSKGFSSIAVELDPSADTNEILNDIRSKVDQAKASFPEDAEDPNIESIVAGEDPIFVIRLASEDSDVVLRDKAEELKQFLEFDGNIKEVNISGGAEREVIVDLDPAKLLQYGINTAEVVNAIRSAHRDSPIGDLGINNTEYSLRVQGRHQTAEDVARVVVKTLANDGNFSPITVNQLGTVAEKGEKTTTLQRFIDVEAGKDPRNTISLAVIKKNGIDIFKSDPVIRQKTANFVAEEFGDSVELYYTQELVDEVSESYGTVLRSALQSILMVIILLILFLRAKESLVASIVIPLAFLSTITTTFIRGETLNFMVNFSMVLALGILVDVSIVIVEGIYEELRKGKPPKEAALHALHEFKAPLISGTLTTLAVFIPLLGLPDILGKFLSFIPISVSITLTASLFIALLIVPGIASVLLSNTDHEKEKPSRLERYYRWRDGKIEQISTAYQNLLRRALDSRAYRAGGFYIIIVICILTFLLPVPFTLFPADDFNLMQVGVVLSEGKEKEKTLEATIPVEDILRGIPEIQYVVTDITDNEASILIEFFEKEVREDQGLRTSLEIGDYLREQFVAFTNYDVRINEAEFGPPSEAPVAFRVVTQNAEDLSVALEVVEDFKDILKSIPHTENVRDNANITPGEITYRVDQEAALRLGVDTSQASTAARAAVDGVVAASITRGNQEVDIRVQYDPDQVRSFQDINQIQIVNRNGDGINFSQIVDEEFGSALSEIKRVDRQIAITVSSDLNREGNAFEVTNAFVEQAAAYDLPSGISYVDAGENAENAALFFALAAGFLIAMILIFSILVIQFNSFGQPGIILFTILMSLMGVNIGMWITGLPRSLAFIIGVISLAGIVVNDAIVLVDRINNLRKKKPLQDLKKTITEAGRTRFQPIVLTTLTTAAGVFPLLFVDSFWAGLSVTIIFGLVVASTLTLFITPAMYYQINTEAGLSYLPLIILIGLGVLIPGLFSLSLGSIVVGGLITGISGKIWWKKWKGRTLSPAA